MAAFLIALSKVKDPNKLKEYAAAAGPTFAPFGGAPVARGQVKQLLVGQLDAELSVVVRFPDVKAVTDWYHSKAYQALLPVRDAAIDATFLVIEEPPSQ